MPEKEPKKILLVEDDPFLVDIYTTKLQQGNFIVESAVDGEEALLKAKQLKPDLIFLDIVLPKLDGWEVLKRIKEDPLTSSLKVVFLSNLSQSEEVKKGLSLGAISYLIKSHYAPSEIVEVAEKILYNTSNS